MIGPEYVKPGAVVVDVGMNRDENGKLCGDVDFADLLELLSTWGPCAGPCRASTASKSLSRHRHESFR